MEIVTSIKTVVDIVFSIIMAYCACLGLGAWKKQLKGKDDYDLARRLLVTVYRLRDAISLVRNPIMLPYETQEEEEFPSIKGTIKAYRKRWGFLAEVLHDYEAILVEAEVLWEGTRDILFPLKSSINKLGMALTQHLQNQCHPRENREDEEIRDLIYEGRKDGDPFKQEILDIVEDIESLCRKHFK